MPVFARPAPPALLVDALDEPAAAVTPSGGVLAANAAWRQAFGAASPDEAMELAGLTPAEAFQMARAARAGERLAIDAAGGAAQVAPLGPAARLWRIAPPARQAQKLVDAVAAALAAPPPRDCAPVDAGALMAAIPIARLDPADPAARPARGNAAFLKAFGDAAGATPFLDLFAAAEAEGLRQALRAPPAQPVEAASAADPARVFEVAVARDADGPVALFFDVSARREIDTQLTQSAKLSAIGQIAGGVAHELNNLLNVIVLNGGKLLSRHPAGDPDYFHLQQIDQTTTRASELVRQLLAYSRKQTMRRQTIDLTELLADLSVLLRQVVDERVTLEVAHARDLPAIWADRQQLETVLMNLVTNARDAIHAAGGRGRIWVRTGRATREEVIDATRAYGVHDAPEGAYAMLAVEDTGGGIPPDVQAKIFEPFFTTKEPGKGTGLGLAMVYGIVKQSGGYIALDTVQGKGTTFRIFLPERKAAAGEAEAPAAPAAAAPRPADLAGRGRILLVDDEEGLRAITASLLAERGYEVVQAGDGEEALAILEDAPDSFDLMISDVVMPGLDGPSLLKAARPYLGAARVVFVSGYAERDFSRTLDEERHVSFLPKPFTLQQLAERVKDELAA